MTDNIWFSEDLMVPENLLTEAVKDMSSLPQTELAQVLGIEGDESTDLSLAQLAQKITAGINAVIRLHTPRSRLLTKEQTAEFSVSGKSKVFLIRMGVEFDLSKLGGGNWHFTAAWYRVYLWTRGKVQPRVLRIYPEREYDGGQRKINAKIGIPVIGAEISEDILVGQVCPIMLGFYGQKECKPYWELRHGPKPIEGIYNFWAMVETPEDEPTYLSALAEADLQIHKWKLPIGPKEKRWSERQKIQLL